MKNWMLFIIFMWKIIIIQNLWLRYYWIERLITLEHLGLEVLSAKLKKEDIVAKYDKASMIGKWPGKREVLYIYFC